MRASLLPFLLLALLAVPVYSKGHDDHDERIEMAANQTSQCNLCCRGPPGRDGRDGPPGLSSPISHQDYINIKKELEQEFNKQILTELENMTEYVHQNCCTIKEEIHDSLEEQTIAELRSNLTGYFHQQILIVKEELQKDLKQQILTELRDNLTATEDKDQDCRNIGKTPNKPASSCREIYLCNDAAPSGHYWIRTVQDNRVVPVSIYCYNSLLINCGISRGWRKVADVNMTNPSETCPSPLRTITSPKRMCGRSAVNRGCSSVKFSTSSIPYTRVCGRAVGYAYYSPDAFYPKASGINGVYAEGLSITHGQPRKHIWTYAAGLSEDHDNTDSNCPCAVHSGPSPPAFVGEHYHCESGNTGPSESQWYTSDPLWDGKGCEAGSNCCSTSGLPWFSRTLSYSTIDDIEVRWCADNHAMRDEDVATELLEIYIL